MRYEEFRPAEPLAQFVKCFWVLESETAASAEPERILPDGCTEFVFHLADPFDRHHIDGTTERQPLALLVGQMRHHLLIKPTGRVRVLGVRFWPGGAYPFLRLPQYQIAGQIIPLDAIWGSIAAEAHSRIADAGAPADAVSQIETVLLAWLDKSRRADQGVTRAIGLILQSEGSVPVERLAGDLGMSLRTLDRTFNVRVGLPPKALCRIVRFQKVFRLIERQPRPDWVRVAVDCGYYDQPHFIREFNAIAGIGPASYFAEQNALSDLFTSSS
jgi:AraC-like DNA-binding protein